MNTTVEINKTENIKIENNQQNKKNRIDKLLARLANKKQKGSNK